MDLNDKDRLIELIGRHEELWEWIRKLDSGSGTYEEVSKIAELLGDEIAAELIRNYSDELMDVLTMAGYEVVSESGIVAQTNLNNAARIGLKPLTKKYPKSAVSALKEEVAAVAPEELGAMLSNSLPTMMLGLVDDIVKYNMDFQAKAGLTPIIVRTWSGRYPSHDTKHTDWCHDLAGTYVYGTEPKNVYARLPGCRCRVEYFPNARAKGNITALAKGEVDVDSVLWNTKAETLEKRLARAQSK